MKSISIEGKEYPCLITMGAMLRFKEQTGREVSELSSGSLSELVVFLWCCIASACAKEKVEFGMSVMEFADSIEPDKIAEFYKDEMEKPGDGQKKSQESLKK